MCELDTETGHFCAFLLELRPQHEYFLSMNFTEERRERLLGLRTLRGMYEAPFTVDKGRAALAGG